MQEIKPVSRAECLMYGLLGSGAACSLIRELQEPDWTAPTIAAIVFSSIWPLIFFGAVLMHMSKFLGQNSGAGSAARSDPRSLFAFGVLKSVRAHRPMAAIEQGSPVRDDPAQGGLLPSTPKHITSGSVRREPRLLAPDPLLATIISRLLNSRSIGGGSIVRLKPQFTYDLRSL